MDILETKTPIVNMSDLYEVLESKENYITYLTKTGYIKKVYYEFSKADINEYELFTLDKVADLSKHNIQTIRRYIKEGRLQARKQGKAYYVTGEELKKLIKK